METYHPGEIVLLSSPLSDLTEARQRPGLVLLDTGEADILVARVTSQAVRDQFDIALEDWQAAGLLMPSIVRVHKLATLGKGIVRRRLGALTNHDWLGVRQASERLWING